MALFNKARTFEFERVYDATVDQVWRAWTDATLVAGWWGVDKTMVDECEVDPRVGGRIHIVAVATEEMGNYAGTRWPMSGTFTAVEPLKRLAWDARSWTDGSEATTTIVHANEVTFSEDAGKTAIVLRVDISDIGKGAKMAAFGMKWGYKQYLDNLETVLAPT